MAQLLSGMITHAGIALAEAAPSARTALRSGLSAEIARVLRGLKCRLTPSRCSNTTVATQQRAPPSASSRPRPRLTPSLRVSPDPRKMPGWPLLLGGYSAHAWSSGINLPDLGAAKRYYETLMPLVGLQLFLEAEDQFAYKPADDRPGTYLFFYPTAADGDYSPDRTGLQHLAFMVRRRSLVDHVHDFVVRSGNTVLHPLSTSRGTRALTTPPFGLIRSALSSRRSATTTGTEIPQPSLRVQLPRHRVHVRIADVCYSRP